MEQLKKACRETRKVEETLSHLYAVSSLRHYGKFQPEIMTVDMLYEEHEIDQIVEKENTNIQEKRKFIQAWKHEYWHMFQCLNLDSMIIYSRVKRNLLKVESAILIKAVENGCTWNIGSKYNKILSIIEQGLYQPPPSFEEDIVEHITTYSNYSKEYVYSERGLSFINIVESMVHFLSKPYIEKQFCDQLCLDKHHLYGGAYDLFLKRGGNKIEGAFLKQIVFTYFCYFALKFQYPRQAVRAFISYCDNLAEHFSAFRHEVCSEELSQQTESYSQLLGVDLKESVHHGFVRQAMHFISTLRASFNKESNQHSETIPVLKLSPDEIARREYIFPNQSQINKDYFVLFSILQPDLFWTWTMKARDMPEVKYLLGDSEVLMQSEQEFYKFTLNFRKLLSPSQYPWCCEKHGTTLDIKQILSCSNNESFQDTFNQLTGRKLVEVIEL